MIGSRERHDDLSCIHYLPPIRESATASTPADDTSSAGTDNVAKSLASASTYTAALDLCATSAHAVRRRR